MRKRKPTYFFVSCLFTTSFLWGNPSGEQINHGECTFNRGKDSLSINQQSNQAIVHWDDFSITQGETTRITLPSADSSILNRVMSNHPSSIQGKLESNGKVFLINQNGILIGPSGIIRTNGFVASCLNTTNAEFLSNGNLNLKGTSNAGIINEGSIDALQGNILLVAREVHNNGDLLATNGSVALAAGCEVLIAQETNQKFIIRVKGEGTLSNSGLIEAVHNELKASGGDLGALAIQQDGVIQAMATMEKEAQIFLEAEVGTVSVKGTMTASNGGEIHVLGQDVRLEEKALLDVSYDLDGGTILIGGDFQGNNPEIQNAKFTFVGADTVLLADSHSSGNGGKIILWGDDACRFGGKASAKGGSIQGDGGLIEVSSLQDLVYKGEVDTKAPFGKAGMLLLDPTNITIANSAGPSVPAFPTTAGPPTDFYTPTSNGTLADDNVQAALVAGNNVTIQTSGGATGVGTVTINTGVNITWGTANTLTIAADRNIIMTSGATFESQNALATFTSMNFTATGNTAVNYDGINLAGGLITANGHITLTGRGGNAGNDNRGIYLPSTGSITSTGSGDITLNGTGGDGSIRNSGVDFVSGTITSSGTGDVILIGQGGTASTSGENEGVIFQPGTIIQTGTGGVSLTGTGGSGPSGHNMGVFLNNGTISSSGGDITITAPSNTLSGGIRNRGIRIEGLNVLATNNAAITLTSVGNTGTTENEGIRLTQGTIGMSSENGDITINASTIAGGTGFIGNMRVSSSGSGNIVVNGTGTSAEGILIASQSFQTNTGSLTFTGNGTIDLSITSGISPIISSTSGGNIELNANTINLAAAGNNFSSSGTLVIAPRTASTTIGLGTAATGTLNLDTTELGKLANGFSLITIGRADGTGAIDVKGHSFSDPIFIQGGPIAVGGTLNASGANVSLTGTGGNSGSNNDGIVVTGTITSAETITLVGTGGNGVNANSGVHLIGGVITSNTAGNIVITGQGGVSATGSENSGVRVAPGTVNQTGTGSITITGTAGGGSGGTCRGCVLSAGAVESSGGDINIITPASAFPTGASNEGLVVSNSTITGTANAGIVINASGSSGTTANNGITHLSGVISTVNGDISITGSTTATGIGVASGPISSTGSGNIVVNGTGTSGDGILIASQSFQTNTGSLTLTGNGTIDLNAAAGTGVSSTAGGDITLNVNTIALTAGGNQLSSTGDLVIAPRTASTTIGLGTGSGTLNLDATELGKIANGFSTITIGRADGTGAINAAGATFNDPVTLQGGAFTASGNLSGNGGCTILSTTSVAINPGFTVSSVTSGDVRISTISDTSSFGVGTAATGSFIDDASLGRISSAANIHFGGAFDAADNTIDVNTAAGPFTDPLLFVGKTITVSGALNAGTQNVTFRCAEISNGGVTLNNTITTGPGTITAAAGQGTLNTVNGVFNISTIDTMTVTGSAAGTANELQGPAAGTNIWTFASPSAGTLVNGANTVTFTNIQTTTANGTDNTITAPSGRDNIWTISAQNAGSIDTTPVINFTNMQNLVGGDQIDDFRFDANFGVDGTINGSAGANIISYANYTIPVTINLQTGAATKINNNGPGGFSNIQTFTGAAGQANTLTGPAAVNTWNITSGNSGTVGAFTFNNIAKLIGSGTDDDTFIFANQIAVTGFVNGGDPLPANNTLDYSAFVPNALVYYDPTTGSGNVQDAMKNILYPFVNIKSVIGNVSFVSDIAPPVPPAPPEPVTVVTAEIRTYSVQSNLSIMLELNPSRKSIDSSTEFQYILYGPISAQLLYGNNYGSLLKALNKQIESSSYLEKMESFLDSNHLFHKKNSTEAPSTKL